MPIPTPKSIILLDLLESLRYVDDQIHKASHIARNATLIKRVIAANDADITASVTKAQDLLHEAAQQLGQHLGSLRNRALKLREEEQQAS